MFRGYELTDIFEQKWCGRFVVLDSQSDFGTVASIAKDVDGLVVSDGCQKYIVDFNDGIADIQMVVIVLVATHFGYQNGQVVVATAFDADAQFTI